MQTNEPVIKFKTPGKKSSVGKSTCCFLPKEIQSKKTVLKDKSTVENQPLIRKIRAEGEKQFIEVYSNNLQKILGNRIVNKKIWFKSMNMITDEVSVEELFPINSKFSMMQPMLQALEETLKMQNIVMKAETKLQVGQVVIKIDKNLIEAISGANEITFIITYQTNKKLKGKAKARVCNLVNYFYDPCFTEVEGYEFYLNRYHHASFAEPFPVKQVEEIMKGSACIVEEFTEINEIICEFQSTGIVL